MGVEETAEPAKAEDKAKAPDPAKAEEPTKAEAATKKTTLTDVQIENVRKGFKASDTDNSGAIEANELKVIMKALDVEMTNEDVLAVLKNIDIDGSGKIEFDEFLTMVEESLNQKG